MTSEADNKEQQTIESINNYSEVSNSGVVYLGQGFIFVFIGNYYLGFKIGEQGPTELEEITDVTDDGIVCVRSDRGIEQFNVQKGLENSWLSGFIEFTEVWKSIQEWSIAELKDDIICFTPYKKQTT